MAAPIVPAAQLTVATARRIYAAAQQLADSAADASISRVLEETGFVRTLGGVDVYLALRARIPGLRRQDLDAAVASGEAQVLPAVRGCMYLVPRRDAALALRVADLLSSQREARDQEKAGIEPGEVEQVARAVLGVLREKGPLTTDGLRRALPSGTLRSLGDRGKKVGVSSALPGALRRLEFAGEVERRPEENRLDNERYLWRLPEASPFSGVRLPDDRIELYARLAAIFYRGAGLGTLKDFAAWAGIAQRDAKAALERTPLVPVGIEGEPEIHYLFEERRDWVRMAPEAASALSFLPFEDNLVAYHGGPARLTDPAYHGLRFEEAEWGSAKGGSTLGEARFAVYRPLVAADRIAGFWEFDPESGEVFAHRLDAAADGLAAALPAATASLAGFIAAELGHGRSFSLDGDAHLRRRVGQLRELAARR